MDEVGNLNFDRLSLISFMELATTWLPISSRMMLASVVKMLSDPSRVKISSPATKLKLLLSEEPSVTVDLHELRLISVCSKCGSRSFRKAGLIETVLSLGLLDREAFISLKLRFVSIDGVKIRLSDATEKALNFGTRESLTCASDRGSSLADLLNGFAAEFLSIAI